MRNISLRRSIFIVFNIILSTPRIHTDRRCNRSLNITLAVYHLVAKHHRSQMTVIARANYKSLSSCQRLAAERRGLAINFSPPEEASKIDFYEDYNFYACLVLECPETDTGLSLLYDTRYDYYSLYSDPVPDENSTCLTSVGVFSIGSKHLNYTEAAAACNKTHGALANPSTDLRTNTLCDLLKASSIHEAYVGLNSIDVPGRYTTSEGESLECTTYRAWAPGHPRRRHRDYECVTIEKNKVWKSIKCEKRMPYICEIFPNGPYVPGNMNITHYNNTKNGNLQRYIK